MQSSPWCALREHPAAVLPRSTCQCWLGSSGLCWYEATVPRRGRNCSLKHEPKTVWTRNVEWGPVLPLVKSALWAPERKPTVRGAKTLLHQATGWGKGTWQGLRALSGFQASWSEGLHFVSSAGRNLPVSATGRLQQPVLVLLPRLVTEWTPWAQDSFRAGVSDSLISVIMSEGPYEI